MALTTAKVVDWFDDVESGVPIACDWSLFSKSEVHVYYGLARDEAIQNVDYTVTLAAPAYATFTITPTSALLVKINGLIALNDAETNYVEVRREVGMLTEATASAMQSTANVAREIERITQRMQQLAERLDRAFVLPGRQSGYAFDLPVYEAGKALSWHPTLKKLINSTQRVDQEATAQAVAAAATATANAIATAADAAATEADKVATLAAASSAIAAAASVLSVSQGGSPGDYLTKTGAGDDDYDWTTPSAVDVAAALHGATAGSATPADTDGLSGTTAAGAIRRWAFSDIRSWILTFLANLLHQTGEIAFFDRTTAPSGWVKRNGGSIGNASSGATTRANADTAALFALYWGFNATDCPIQTSAGAASTRGADAATDFAANKRIVMPDTRGEFLRGWDDGRGVDTSRRIGSAQAEMIGPHTHPLAMNAVPDHQHTINLPKGDAVFGQANGNTLWGNNLNRAFTTAAAGGHTPTGTATDNAGTENRPRNSAALACVKL